MAKEKTRTKTWKIGECAQGGVITIEVTGKQIDIIGKEWDFSTGTRRSSNQSNAKEFIRTTVMANENNAYWKIKETLEDLTTSYHRGEMMKWIESKVKIEFDF